MQALTIQTLQKKLLSLLPPNSKQSPRTPTQTPDKKDPNPSPTSIINPTPMSTSTSTAAKDINTRLTISYTIMQKMPLTIKKVFEDHYQALVELTIINCDLRTFQNFPKLRGLRNLNVSKNSLRGSFQFIVKNRTLKYMDVSHNIISDIKKFQPLRCLKDFSLYAKFNPFDPKPQQSPSNHNHHHQKSSIPEQLKHLNIKYLQRPLTPTPTLPQSQSQSQSQTTQKQLKKQQKQRYPKPSLLPLPSHLSALSGHLPISESLSSNLSRKFQMEKYLSQRRTRRNLRILEEEEFFMREHREHRERERERERQRERERRELGRRMYGMAKSLVINNQFNLSIQNPSESDQEVPPLPIEDLSFLINSHQNIIQNNSSNPNNNQDSDSSNSDSDDDDDEANNQIIQRIKIQSQSLNTQRQPQSPAPGIQPSPQPQPQPQLQQQQLQQNDNENLQDDDDEDDDQELDIMPLEVDQSIFNVFGFTEREDRGDRDGRDVLRGVRWENQDNQDNEDNQDNQDNEDNEDDDEDMDGDVLSLVDSNLSQQDNY